LAFYFNILTTMHGHITSNFNTAIPTLVINHGVTHNPQPVLKTDVSTTYNKLKLIENY